MRLFRQQLLPLTCLAVLFPGLAACGEDPPPPGKPAEASAPESEPTAGLEPAAAPQASAEEPSTPAMPTTCTLKGVVNADPEGTPLQDFTVTVVHKLPGGHKREKHEIHDPEGKLEITGVDRGLVGMIIEAEGYVPGLLGFRDLEPGEHGLTVFMKPAVALTILVTYADGTPVPGADLTVRDVNDLPVAWSKTDPLVLLDRTLPQPRARTDEDGKFTFPALPATAIIIMVNDYSINKSEYMPLDLTQPVTGVPTLKLGWNEGQG